MNPTLALVGGKIFPSPGEPAIQDGVVLIAEDEILQVGDSFDLPQTAYILDCSGCCITAGFWNSHVHFFERKWMDAAGIPASELREQLENMLNRFAFTSVFDLSSAWRNTKQIRDRIESRKVPGPEIRSTGEGLIPPNTLPADAVLHLMGVMNIPLPEIEDAGQATVACTKLLEQGVDGIKLFASSPRGTILPQSAIEAAVRETHRFGKPVFTHPNTAEDVLNAVRGGVDVIGHTTPRSGKWDEQLLILMKQKDVALIPTLALWKHFSRHDRASTQRSIVQTAIGQLRDWRAVSGKILFGTDLGAMEYDPTDEYVLMTESGMDFNEILASLTTIPAMQFGKADRSGKIAPGFQADLAVLKNDPSQNISALTAVKYTLRAGKIVYPSLSM
jgi:imidazolonepropionase-like amidohydrolase